MTPHELNLHIYNYVGIVKKEQEDNVVQAYLTAYWQRVKRMPSLKSVLDDMKPKQIMTDEEMLLQVEMLNDKLNRTAERTGI